MESMEMNSEEITEEAAEVATLEVTTSENTTLTMKALSLLRKKRENTTLQGDKEVDAVVNSEETAAHTEEVSIVENTVENTVVDVVEISTVEVKLEREAEVADPGFNVSIEVEVM